MNTILKTLCFIGLVPVLAAAGCAADSSRGMRETTGVLTGAALGGLLGCSVAGW